MQRRDHLKQLAVGCGLIAAPAIASRAFAAPGAAGSRFLLVFLRGGYDAANVLVPTGSDFYYTARPTIAIRAPAAQAEDDPQAAVAMAGAGPWALHPALAPTLAPLWAARQLAFVPFAGTTDLSRSHFETQDSVEAGLPLANEPAPADVASLRGSGFLNRLAGVLGQRAAPVAFTDGMPMAWSGKLQVPNVSLKGAARTAFDQRQSERLASMYRGTRFEPLVAEGFELRRSVAEEAQAQERRGAARPMDRAMASANPSANPSVEARMQEMDAANRRALSARGFEVEARRMAGLMRDRFNLGFIDVGGWDTHVNQGAAQGQLANLLSNLGSGLDGFAQEIGTAAWGRTVVVVVSEFGRTLRENGTRGTDHGHGTTFWALGGAVRGGRIAGEQVAVDAASLNQNRDFPVLNDYRAVLGGIFGRLYGLDAARLAQVFPGARPTDLGLV